MASSYSSLLRLEKMANGELDDTWGTQLNNVLEMIEDSISGKASVTHDDTATYTLTTANGTVDEARMMAIEVGGALGAARNVVCPTSAKLYIVKNATTGGFAFTFKTSAGTGISVPNGATMILRCDGTNVVNGIDFLSFVQNSSTVYLTSTSGTNTITATATPIPSAYAAGQKFHFIPAATNTGATTLNPSSLGAKNIFSNGAACVGGEIKINVPCVVVYDGTQFNIVSGGVAVAGAELAYGEITSPVTVTATTSAGADTIVSSGAVTYDGTAVYVECYSPHLDTGANYITLVLYDGATQLGKLGTSSTAASVGPITARRKLTPSAGSHTYIIKAYVNTGTGGVGANNGASGNDMPTFCRVVKA